MGFWDTLSNAFSRDGGATVFLEKLPVVGYGVALGHAIAGNSDHAKRAVATSTNSVITVVGSVGGAAAGAAAGVVGGPVGVIVGAMAGGAAGGAAAAQVGMVTEYGIATTINDDKVKGDVGEVSWERAGKDALFGAIGGLASGGAGSGAAKIVTETTKAGLKTGSVQVMTKVGEELVAQVGKEGLKKTATAVVSTIAQSTTKAAFQQGQQSQPKPDTEDEEDPEKPKHKGVVTAAQDAKARVVELRCNEIVTKYPLNRSTRDAFTTFSYVLPAIRDGQDWEFASKGVDLQLDSLEKKMKGTPPYQRVEDICLGELEAIHAGGRKNTSPAREIWAAFDSKTAFAQHGSLKELNYVHQDIVQLSWELFGKCTELKAEMDEGPRWVPVQ